MPSGSGVTGRARLWRGLAACAAIVAVGSGCAAARLSEPTREHVLERILPASVQITLERDARRFRTGSGVVIGQRRSAQGNECFVLTAGHTFSHLSGQEAVYVLFGRHQGAGTKLRATVLAQWDNDTLDLALLSVQSDRCLPAPFGRLPALGEAIWVVAFPWGRNMTLIGGNISQLNDADATTALETASRLMVGASVSYGASGGGVYEARTGGLIGLVEGYRTARVSFQANGAPTHIDVPVPGETYVIPLSDIRRFLLETGHARLLGDGPSIAKPRD